MYKTLSGLACLAAAAAVLGGCATKTPVSGTFPPITPRAAQGGQDNGTVVRWGGILIKTLPESKQTCFRVLGLPLSNNGRPRRDTATRGTGRFLACAPGFYDPVVYAAHKKITFIGTIQGVRTQTVGKYRYPYPVLDASTVYLWPRVERVRTVPYYYPSYYWGPGGPWGPWQGGLGWWWGDPGDDWPPYYYDHDVHHRPDHPQPAPQPPPRIEPHPPLHRPIVHPRPPLRPPVTHPKSDRPHPKTEPPR